VSTWLAEPSVSLPVVVTAAVYLRGWSLVRRRLAPRFDARHAVIFLSALAIMMLALSPPFEALTQRWLAAHMVQHMLLMVVVAPLLWMGAPVVPLFVGLPRWVRGIVLAFAKGAAGRHVTRWLLHPGVGWIAFALAFWVWHTPALYDLALESDLWHHVEHACFLVSALLFWRPVILAWPARMTWPRWTMIPYLALAMFQGLPLATILTFSARVIYTAYASIDDQALAGVIMWVPGSIPLLLAILRLVVELSSRPVPIASHHA
jgi:cytochrome c oxidase assembly factor CtaG